MTGAENAWDGPLEVSSALDFSWAVFFGEALAVLSGSGRSWGDESEFWAACSNIAVSAHSCLAACLSLMVAK